MQKQYGQRTITSKEIGAYARYLREQEKSLSTIQTYIRSLKVLLESLQGAGLTKSALLAFKEDLAGQYSAASVNVILAATNGFLSFCGWTDLKIKPLRVQRDLFCDEEKELTREEYARLVNAAEHGGNRRLSLVIQTICATGIRVSELTFITVEAVQAGRASVCCKGKRRTVFLPDKLRRSLLEYAKERKRTAGTIFVTSRGKPLDRSNIWREMKTLCGSALVAPEKVFPHNLRHLFARTYYSLEKDLSRLADILGHVNINTTRIYTVESGAVHARQIGRMGLFIT